MRWKPLVFRNRHTPPNCNIVIHFTNKLGCRHVNPYNILNAGIISNEYKNAGIHSTLLQEYSVPLIQHIGVQKAEGDAVCYIMCIKQLHYDDYWRVTWMTLTILWFVTIQCFEGMLPGFHVDHVETQTHLHTFRIQAQPLTASAPPEGSIFPRQEYSPCLTNM